ncbi:MAG: SIS domain-containing protein [Opitutus sp.]
MSVNLSILEGAYLRDLLEQPHAVAHAIRRLAHTASLPKRALACQRLILTGMGSSLHSLYPLQLRLARAGRVALMVETAELIHSQSTLLTEDTLLIVVSQSGRSIETIQLLELIRTQPTKPFVVGLTNTPDSDLAWKSDTVLLMNAGPEYSVSCKTYLATLVLLEWLGGALCGDDLNVIIAELERGAPAVETYLTDWRKHVAELASVFTDIRHLFLTGRGASLATANTGALILKESTRFHAEGMSSPAFRHGPMEMVTPGVFAVVFDGHPATRALNQTLVRDIRTAGGRANLVGVESEIGAFRLPVVPARLLPVFEMLPIQMLSLALAALIGREPGRFERATKITVVA